jgi:hypothetical protein
MTGGGIASALSTRFCPSVSIPVLSIHSPAALLPGYGVFSVLIFLVCSVLSGFGFIGVDSVMTFFAFF